MTRLVRYAMVPAVAAFAAFFAVAPSGGADRTVRMVAAGEGWRFEPATVTVARGDRVAFVNRSGRTHTATCDGCPWTTRDVQPEQRKMVTFRFDGRYSFSCRYHPEQMTGEIAVGSPASPAPSPAATTSPTAPASPSPPPPEAS